MPSYLTCLRCGHHVRLEEMTAHAGPHTEAPAGTSAHRRQQRRTHRREHLRRGLAGLAQALGLVRTHRVT